MGLQCREQEEAIEREIKAYRTVSGSHVMELLDHCYVVKSGHDKMAYLLFPLMKVSAVTFFIFLRYSICI